MADQTSVADRGDGTSSTLHLPFLEPNFRSKNVAMWIHSKQNMTHSPKSKSSCTSNTGEERKRMLTKRTTRWVRLLSNLFNKMGETTISVFLLLLLASIRVCPNHRFQARMKLVLWSYCLRHEDLLTIRMHA
ncbi:hypothetical protein BDL97_02G100100 [Sphagnum fallax]|nr:hypothetical protein BDL97_02G100100 [Sphagnum fallax]